MLCCLGVGATSGEWKTKYKGLLIYFLLEVSKLTLLFLPSWLKRISDVSEH